MDTILRPAIDDAKNNNAFLQSVLDPSFAVEIGPDDDQEEVLLIFEEPDYSHKFYKSSSEFFAEQYERDEYKEDGVGLADYTQELFETINSTLQMLNVPSTTTGISRLSERDTTYNRPDFSVLQGFVTRQGKRKDEDINSSFPSKK